MELLNYFLAVVICFFGIYAGFFLGMLAKEELKAGRKYFIVFQKILLIIMVASAIFVVKNIFISLCLIGVLVYLIFAKHRAKDIAVYVIFGVLIFLSSRYDNLFLMQASLVFLYSLFTGSLLAADKKKLRVIASIFMRYIWFVAAALALFTVF